MPLALRLVGSSHDGVDVDVSVEAGGRQHRGVPGAPLDVKAPLAAGGQLVQHLLGGGLLLATSTDPIRRKMTTAALWSLFTADLYLGRVWVPAQNPVVLPAAQQQLGIRQAPVDGEDASVCGQQDGYVFERPQAGYKSHAAPAPN